MFEASIKFARAFHFIELCVPPLATGGSAQARGFATGVGFKADMGGPVFLGADLT